MLPIPFVCIRELLRDLGRWILGKLGLRPWD